MKILFLTIKLPHSRVVGGNRIVFQRIRHLAQNGHTVGLISYTSTETREEIDSLREYVDDLHTIPQPRRNFAIRALHDYIAPSRPASIWKLYSKEMMCTVGDVVEHGKYDLVIAEFSEMGQFLYKNPYLSAVHTIVSCHRCITASYEKYREMEEVRWRLHVKSLPQLRGLRKYEFNMYRSADRILVFTPQDRFTMQYYAPDLAVTVSPSGVDIAELQEHPPVPKEPIILMTGYMRDPANEDGVEWFVHHVWPKLRDRHPEIKFYIVGADPSPRIKKLVMNDHRIVVTGLVDDLRPYRNRARVMVSPVRLGSGMRTKVLEAMAFGLPVVSTSLGIAGIDAQTGVNCLVADTPELFTQSVSWLFTDRELSARMARNAQKLIQNKYALEVGLNQFESVLKSVVEG
jgi:glycosyltransferase involved in cell wall biosynthesis